MPKLLTSYIIKQISLAIFIVLLVIMSLTILAALIDELGELKNNYTFIEAVRYVLLTAPSNIAPILPFAVLIGCLLAMGNLANNSELVIMFGAGLSRFHLFMIAVIPALVFSILGFLISEYVAPHTERLGNSFQAQALGKNNTKKFEKGFWHREGNQFIHASAIDPNGDLIGLHIYEFDDNRQLLASRYAKKAHFIDNVTPAYWRLSEVKTSLLKESSIKAYEQVEENWYGKLSPEELDALGVSPENLSLVGLWQYSRYLKAQNVSAALYELAFWKKALQPLAILSLLTVAMVFIFGSLREVTMGYRIFIGVLVGIIFRTSQEILAPMSMVMGFSPIIAVLLPILLCFFVGFLVMKKVT